MKKRKIICSLALTILALIILPNNILASQCRIITGDGTNIGDEIDCGGEHFYVISSDNEEIKMLSKYNLYVGYMIEEADEYLFEDYEDDYDALYDDALAHEEEVKAKYPGKKVVLTSKLSVDEEGNINDLGLFYRVFTPLEYDEVKQSEDALGLTIVDGQVKYPLYGDVSIDGEQDYELLEEIENPFDENGNLILENTSVGSYLEQYKQTLKGKGIEIENIDFIHRSGIEELIKNISGEEIDLGFQYNEDGYIEINIEDLQLLPGSNTIITKKNLKEYITEKYDWIIKTSYWIGSGSPDYLYGPYTFTDEFLTTYGDYCSNARGCNNEPNIGIGLRPVVTIKKSAIEPYSYQFISGENQTFEINNVDNYTFTIDGDYSLFESLIIDNETFIKDVDYTVTEGSTIITLQEPGIKKLNNMNIGTHEVVVKYTNNKEVKGKLVINNKIENPETIDNIDKYIYISIIASIGIIITFKKNKTVKD